MWRRLATIREASMVIIENTAKFSLEVDYEEGMSQTIFTTEFEQLLYTLDIEDITGAVGGVVFIIGHNNDVGFRVDGIKALRSSGGRKLIFKE